VNLTGPTVLEPAISGVTGRRVAGVQREDAACGRTGIARVGLSHAQEIVAMTETMWRIGSYVVFFVVPFLFWWVLTRVLQRGRARTWSAVVTGNDGRLSLSRLQAFAWTLIILGSFCAAMTVRPWPVLADKTEIAARETALKEAKTKLDAAAVAVESATAEMLTASANLIAPRRLRDEAQAAKMLADTNAKAAAEDAKVAAEKARTAPPANEVAATDALKTAEAKATTAEVAATAATNVLAIRQKALSDVALKAQEHEDKVKTLIAMREAVGKQHDTARTRFRRTHWVRIPLELLALAGISLATGVFAAAISASGSTNAPPAVTSVERMAAPDTLPPGWPAGLKNVVEITGTSFGTSGDVRLNQNYVRWLSWGEAKIVIEPADKYETLTVDTPNGKVSHKLAAGPKLGEPVVIHESADLFREDNNPRIFSMTKFQMFAWTVVAIVFYVCVLFSNLNADIDTLPVVDATLVLLTGLSVGGYLGGKAASNMSPPK
jgi:hypothetical protein